MLILDEPTSGVDPVARDGFWRYLISLSRDEGVTIFVSTHFMNEAERCDRISLMNAGKVLAVGPPRELAQRRGMKSLEEAFIAYLEDAAGFEPGAKPSEAEAPPEPSKPRPRRPREPRCSICAASGPMRGGRRWRSCGIRSASRSRSSALSSCWWLSVTASRSMSNTSPTPPSTRIRRTRAGNSSKIFRDPGISPNIVKLPAKTELEQRLKSGELAVAVEIPPNFGEDLVSDKQPEVSVWLDGAMPFRAETANGYVTGLELSYLADQAARGHISGLDPPPVNIEERFRYNQAFKSVYATIPGTIMLVMILFPAMMTAVGVAREKETGSIANFRSTPITRHRIPAWQATAIRRHRDRQLPHAFCRWRYSFSACR